MTGRKYDQEKPDYTLLNRTSLEACIRVLEHGARKYDRDNWVKVPDAKNRYVRAAIRHLFAHADGERLDPESSLPHLSHAMASVMFALYFEVKDNGLEENNMSKQKSQREHS